MYTATSPAWPTSRPADQGWIPLALARIDHQLFDPGQGKPFGWDDHIYFPDLMRSYGLDCRAEQFAGRRNSFTDMVAATLPRLRSFGERFDIAILTGVTPDSQPGYPMCYLSEAAADSSLAFAVADQGVIAPFTALYVLATCARLDGAARALLMVMDQSTLLHEQPVPPRLQVTRDSSVALVLDRGGKLGLVSVPKSFLVSRSDVTSRFADEAAAAWAGTGAPRVVLCGHGLAAALPRELAADEVVCAGAGLPATGVWSLLAGHRPRWQAGGARVLLADFDPDQHRLSTCLVDLHRQPGHGPGQG